MSKTKLDTNISPVPMPVTIIGTKVDGKPTFMTLAWVTRVNMKPPMWGITMNKKHHTAVGIKQTNMFSINIPNTSLLEKTDVCGLISGRKYDKSSLFHIFYADNQNVPFISECPVNIACKLVKTVDLPTHYFFIGEIEEVFAETDVITEEKLDAQKIAPILLSMPRNKYWALGDQLGNAWKIGFPLKEQLLSGGNVRK